MIILGTDIQAVQAIINQLAKIQEIKDLGDINKILGIRVVRDRPNRKLYLNQEEYINNIVTKFGLQDTIPITLSISDRNTLTNILLGKPLADQVLYQSSIGYIGQVLYGTRFNTLYYLNQLTRQYSNPVLRHWNIVQQ